MNMEREVLILNIEDVLPNRFQPRIKFKEENINELAESIKEHGVIQPIVVRKISDKYEIIAGERRYKASILAGKTTIPAIVTNLDDKNSAEVALIENVQRQNLTPIEEAISYKKILDMGYINQTDLADKLGKTQSTIANKLRLLNLDEEVQDALLNEKISERHARSLLKLEKNKQVEMLNRIISERMTVRKTDEEINKILNSLVEQIETPSLNQVKEQEPEIEILNFDLDDQKQENELEKTMKIPPVTEEEVNNIMKENMNINSIPELNNQSQNNNMNVGDNFINQNSKENEISNMNLFNNSEMSFENQNIEFNNNASERPNTMQQEPNNNVSEISEIMPQEQNNLNEISNSIQQNFNSSENQFNIPSEPIIETVTNEPINYNEQISEISNINQNPIDIADLHKEEYTENPIPVEINTMMEQPEDNDSNSSSGGKFFNMFNMNNQSYVDDIENQQVNMNIEEQNSSTQNPFNFNFDPINQGQQTSEVVSNNLNQPQNNIENTNIFNNQNFDNNLNSSVQPTNNMNNNVNSQNNQPENSEIEYPFQNKLNPYTLNDDEQFTNLAEFQNPSQPEISNQSFNPQPNIQLESNQNQSVSVPQEKFVTGNLRTVINTIRDCADTIEKYGFNIETEELDFEDSYQVTFKISKKN